MDYKSAQKYLDSFINYEKISFDYKRSLKLERVRHLFSLLKINPRELPAVHVAGTKGKGSVSAYCASMLAASGHAAGLYTSPHFFDFRERIRIIRWSSKRLKAVSISRKQVISLLEKFRPVLDREERRLGRQHSFFEVYTALAFRYFMDVKPDLSVIETGMGGRLDATNVLSPLVSVITHIGYDHTHALGSRLADIAFEKAGIIKTGCPVVSALQKKSAEKALRSRARQVKAPLFFSGRDFYPSRIRFRPDYTLFDWVWGRRLIKDVCIGMRGMHQVENASLALACLNILCSRAGFPAAVSDWKKGLRQCFIEGRFETLSRHPRIIADIAHNPSSFSALGDTICRYFPGRRVILVFGASRDKDVKNMVNKIDYNTIIFTPFDNPRSAPARELISRTNIKDAFCASSLSQALTRAEQEYDRDSLIIIAGSFFLVAEAKKVLASQASKKAKVKSKK